MKQDSKNLSTPSKTTNKTVVNRREFLAQVGGIALTTTIATGSTILASPELVQ